MRLVAHPQRYSRLELIRGLDPRRDYHRIYRASALYEFPLDTRLGLLLAFWRTFAVPSIATLLDSTGETTQRTRRRADDTGILMYELIEHGLDHPRGRLATRRLNQLHRRFAISAADYRYVLATFVVVPTRWIDRYGWRPVCCHEKEATFRFYAELGRRMNIGALPADYRDAERFLDAFETRHFGYSAAGARLMAATRGLLARVPAPLVPLAHAATDAMLDPPLRAATGVGAPPRLATGALRVGLATRGWLLRRSGPRLRSHLADGIRARSYPDGYQLAEVGPAEPAVGPAEPEGHHG